MNRILFGLLLVSNLARGATLPASLPGDWSFIGRLNVKTNSDSAVITGGFVADKQAWGDAEMTFRARAPVGTEQVQLWAGLRYKDRDSRYVFALRGGNDNDIYFARYAPDGKMKFLGFAPLDFKPVPGAWYKLRAVALGNRFQIYLNDEKLPRLNIADDDAPWTTGGVCLGGGWLPAEFADLQVKPLTAADKTTFLAVGNECWMAPARDPETQRKTERANYKAAVVTALGPQRTEVSLDGKWLFLPDYELSGPLPVALEYDDQSWHVMNVPEFWTPGLSWLHGETGFPDLKGGSRTKGVADSLYVAETQRADSYTFDWRKTKAAWYRHYVELPSDLGGRHFDLTFEAVAKISEIWVNGVKIGSHTGLFGEIKCDATAALKPGRNVIAVHVTSETDTKASEKVEGVAVTVEVTSQMLRSLPHGMLQGDVGGIWQPVKLTATAPVRVGDCFIEPGLHGADINLEIQGAGPPSAGMAVNYSIMSVQDGSVLYRSPDTAVGETNSLRLSTPSLNPKLWSPSDPNLYNLEVRLQDGQKIIDRNTVRFGFRTFKTDGGKFLLNGKPYWLRGGDPFPNTFRPNDRALAHRFTQLAHDGNVRVTRSHIVPFTSTWLDAADEIGLGVSFEGGWPWLMLHGEPPDTNLLQVWKDEYLSLMRQHRNHPSLILWTVNNEMNFESNDANDPVLLKKKWLILDDMIKAMRKEDPTRPIVADSNYARKKAQKGYKTLVKPLGLDDGDIDDAHCYYGWYNESPFHLFDGEFGKRFSTPGRPLISQEMATGYPNNDDGHPTRFYLFKHHTPQALVGDDAFENADPSIFLQRQAFMTKELAEALRRSDRRDAAGIMHFAYFTWFLQPWSVDKIAPGPAYAALKTALQPVLVSAELYSRHFYAGRTVHARVCIANDSEDGAPLPVSQLKWEVKNGADTLARGIVNVPAVKYYENHWLDVDFALPANLPQPRIDGQLGLKLEAEGRTLSQNSYDILVATPEWAHWKLSEVKYTNFWKIDAQSSPPDINAVRKFVSAGGQVLMLHPGALLPKLFPEVVKTYVPKQGEIVTMRVPESPAFSGIGPLDLSWFERGERRVPLACSGVYKIDPSAPNAIALASYCDIHAYLQNTSDIVKYTGTPLLEIRSGRGRLVASEMCLEAAKADPVAQRLLSTLIQITASGQTFSPAP